MWSNHIGDNTKKLFEEKKKLRQEYEKSKEYKDWEKKVKSFEKNHPDYYDGYDDDFNKLMDERPKKQFNDIISAKVLTKNGWEFCDKEFAKKGGAELSMAKLKDLGYNDESAKYIVDKLIKENQAIDQ